VTLPWRRELKPPLLIVCPDFPPKRGGVADYTGRLARELAGRFQVTVLTTTASQHESDFAVRALDAGWDDAARLAAATMAFSHGGPILWQYVPHMYGRGGVNSAVPLVMDVLRRQGHRQVINAHEIAAGLSPWPHRLYYALAHRRQWRKILKTADAIGVSTEAWLVDWTRRLPVTASKLCLSPSPSAIPRVTVDPGHARRWREQHSLPVEARILAYFGSISGNRHIDWLARSWEAANNSGHPVALVMLGDEPRFDVPATLRELFRPLGFRPADEVSRTLQAADVLALPFIDGVSERRTTFMAGLDHGLPVVSTFGHGTGPALREANFLRGADNRSAEEFIRLTLELLADEPQRAVLGEAGRAAYLERYDWPVTIARIAGLLEPTSESKT
jgi:glycosyltransferase involved in cell wall biosynthesis